MFRNTHRLAKQLAATIAVIALAVPAASVARPDLGGSPDTKGSAIGTQRQEHGYVDLRSPDAKDAGQAAQTSPAIPVVESSGFDWGDAGIGAGSALGLLLIMLAGMFAVVHRRSRSAEAPGGSAVTT